MIFRAYLKEALQSLWSAKQRTLLALVGIFVGIGSVIAMVSVGTIVQSEALRQFKEMGIDILKIMPEMNQDGQQRGPSRFNLKTTRAIPANCPQVDVVAPYLSIFDTLKYQGRKESVPALGVTNAFMDLNKLNLIEGRFISDLDHFMYYCVIGSQVQEKLREFGLTTFIGSKILFKKKQFTIVGVISYAPPTDMRPYEVSEGIMIPISTAKRLDMKSAIQAVIARLAPGGSPEAAEEEIVQYFSTGNRSTGIMVNSAEELIAAMKVQMRMFTLLLGAIGSISLLVGGVGVMNVMLVSVTERKKEIGIRRALGAKQADIQWQFLIESVVLCLVGGLLGVLLGVGASYGVSHFSNWEFMIAYNAIGIGVAFSATVGLFFGFYPARQAARLDPIEASRGE